MVKREVNILDKVRRSALAQGEKGRAWLVALPEQIADVERRFAITIGTTTKNATEAYVAFAETRAGAPVVVKMVIPGYDPTRQEMRLLKAADGQGYARLLDASEADNVMLLERLGPQLHSLDYSDERQMECICATLAEAWQVQARGPFATGAEKSDELAAVIRRHWQALGRPFGEKTYECGLTLAARRRAAFDPAQSVFAHGDAHAWNTLQAAESATGFKFVDPDGAFAERAFDLAIPMREWGAVLPDGDLLALAQARSRSLVQLSGVAALPLWEWSLLQLLSNGLLQLSVGLAAPAHVSFAMAEAWVAAGVFA